MTLHVNTNSYKTLNNTRNKMPKSIEGLGTSYRIINKSAIKRDIAHTFSYNGQAFFSGIYTNKKFQVGNFANTTAVMYLFKEEYTTETETNYLLKKCY